MTIYGVSFDVVGKQPIVLLKTADENLFLPIWIGHPEASAILSRLRGEETARPMTHDLFVAVVDELGAEVVQVSVTELRESTYHAEILLRRGGETFAIDSRPSDAIALAVRTNAPIFAADEVIAANAHEMDPDADGEESENDDPDAQGEIAKFKEFLEQVLPEDFGSGPPADG
jgi:bifunctional DNase/RNase